MQLWYQKPNGRKWSTEVDNEEDAYMALGEIDNPGTVPLMSMQYYAKMFLYNRVGLDVNGVPWEDGQSFKDYCMEQARKRDIWHNTCEADDWYEDKGAWRPDSQQSEAVDEGTVTF